MQLVTVMLKNFVPDLLQPVLLMANYQVAQSADALLVFVMLKVCINH
jgi:hypothetical protein